MKRVPNSKPLLVSAILAILFSFNLSIPQLMQNSEGFPFTYVSESAAKSNPFYKSAADQVIYDYFLTTEKKDPNSNTHEVINPCRRCLVSMNVFRQQDRIGRYVPARASCVRRHSQRTGLRAHNQRERN